MTYAPPALTDFTWPVIFTASPEAVGMERVATNTGARSSATWPSANRAIYVPFQIPETATFQRAYSYNGATANGNIDIGIYDLSGTRLASTGATAQSGTNAVQSIALTAAVTLTPGRYYMAMLGTSATGTVMSHAASVVYQRLGLYYQDVGAGALPSTASFTAWISNILPLFGISQYGF